MGMHSPTGTSHGRMVAQPTAIFVVGGHWYRARIEHLFGQLWHWGLVRNN